MAILCMLYMDDIGINRIGKAFECFKYIKRAVFVFTIVDTINMFIHSIIKIENVRMNKSGVAAWLYNLGYDAHIFITYVFVAVFILCFIYRIKFATYL
mgnify:CR=1 FL=1